MVFVGEDKHLGRYSAELGGIECHLALRRQYAIVVLTVGNEYGSIPFVDETVGRHLKCALCGGVALVPICSVVREVFGVGRSIPCAATHVPVGKPHLFSLKILCLHIEDAGMCDKACETVVVVAGKPVNRETSVACSGGTDMSCVNPWLSLYMVDSREVVAHVLSGIVSGNLRVPFCAESREAAAVGRNHHIAVSGHKSKIPAITPELAHGLLGPTLAVQKSGIFLCGIKILRFYNPGKHLLSVCGGYHAALYGRHSQLSIDVIVDGGDSPGFFAGSRII